MRALKEQKKFVIVEDYIYIYIYIYNCALISILEHKIYLPGSTLQVVVSVGLEFDKIC